MHEAWLRIAGSDETTWNGRGHFFGAAAEAMRRILIDNARRKAAARHGVALVRVGTDKGGAEVAGCPALGRGIAGCPRGTGSARGPRCAQGRVGQASFFRSACHSRKRPMRSASRGDCEARLGVCARVVAAAGDPSDERLNDVCTLSTWSVAFGLVGCRSGFMPRCGRKSRRKAAPTICLQCLGACPEDSY